MGRYARPISDLNGQRCFAAAFHRGGNQIRTALELLPSIIDTLIAAVRNGEFDQQTKKQSTPKTQSKGAA